MMNHLSFTHIAHCIGIVLMLSVIASVPCIAQGKTGTLSGTVLDTEGKPISGFTIGLLPVSLMSKTDKKGAFTFTNVPAGPVQIAIPAQQSGEDEKPVFNFEADHEIVSIKISGITLYQDKDMRPPFGGITFGIKSSSHIADVAVTVHPRMRIRAKVVFKGGKPLANTSISRVVQHDGGTSSGGATAEWIWQNGEPLTYTNWGPKRSFPRSPVSSEEKDNAVMTFVNGQWHAVGPGDLFWRTTKMAILEKSDVPNSSSAEKK